MIENGNFVKLGETTERTQLIELSEMTVQTITVHTPFYCLMPINNNGRLKSLSFEFFGKFKYLIDKSWFN